MKPHLVQALLALEDRAVHEAEDSLQVRGRQHLALEDCPRQVRREAGQVLDAGVGVAFPGVALPGLLPGQAVLG